MPKFLGEDMPRQPSLPAFAFSPGETVGGHIRCPGADNDNLNNSAPLGANLKVVRPRFAAGAPP